MDRVEPPWLGRRKGWIALTQAGLVASVFLLSTIPPGEVGWIGLVAALVAFLSASQDIVIDAWRTDVLPASERGMGASLGVLGYRLAMVLSGGIALIWADPTSGGMSWPEVYRALGLWLAGGAVLGVLLAPSLPPREAPPGGETSILRELGGFAAVVAAAGVGWATARWPGTALGAALVEPLSLADPELTKKLHTGATDLVALALGLAVALPLGAQLARRLGYETLNRSLAAFFEQPRARALLLAVVLYKAGDAFAMALNTTFLLKGPGFTTAEVGVVNKVFGIWLTVVGSLLGGALLPVLGLGRALVAYGLLQAAAVLSFWLLAVSGKGAWGATPLPPFDLGIVWLKEAVDVDHGLLAAVAAENLSAGMGTAAFVALLMGLARSRFSATQYALVSALAAVGRVWAGPFAGVVADVAGWPTFFLVGTVTGVPGVAMVWWLRREIDALAAGEAAQP